MRNPHLIIAAAVTLSVLLPVASSLEAGGALADVQLRVVTDPAPAVQHGFVWDFSDSARDVDHDRLDDLITLVARQGVDALPRHADGFLPYFAGDDGTGPRVSVYVAYQDGVTPADLSRLDDLGAPAPLMDDFWPGLWLAWIDPALAAEIAQLPGVVMVELAPHYRALNVESRTGARVTQTGLYPNSVRDDLGYTGTDVGLAILDTGVDDEHPSLAGSFVAGAMTAYTCGVAAVDGVNPDDDNVVSVAIIGVGVQTFHGTHVAGTAVGSGGGVPALSGMAPDADLYDVKVLTGPGIGCINAVATGLSWVFNFNAGSSIWKSPLNPMSVPASKRISVTSLSLGGGCGNGGSVDESRVDFLANTGGVTSVIATGNDGLIGCITTPSAAETAISVGAYNDVGTTDRDDDVMTSFSNCGTSGHSPTTLDSRKPDVTAAGQNVVSSRGHPVPGQATSNLYHSLSGTSMATPAVAGMVALMMEANPDLRTDPAMVKQILRESAEQKSSGLRGSVDATYGKYHTCWGWGQVDAYGAVKRAEDLVSGSLTGASSTSAGGTLTVTLSIPMTKTEFMNYGPNGISGDGDYVWLELDLPAGWSIASTTPTHGAASGLTGTINSGGGNSDDWVEFKYTGNLKSAPTAAIVDEDSSPSYEITLNVPSTTGTYVLGGEFLINGMDGTPDDLAVTVVP